MNIDQVTQLEDVATETLRDVAVAIKPTGEAYQRRRESVVAQALRNDIHKELRNRFRAQLLLLDVTGEQWQELVLGSADRLERMQAMQEAFIHKVPEQLGRLEVEISALQKRLTVSNARSEADARRLITLATVQLNMASSSAWLIPLAKAIVASTVKSVQDGYCEVLSASDTKVAKSAAIASGKKAIDFIPILGPILTGSADAFEILNKREADLRAASDELTSMDQYLSALEDMALSFEAILALPVDVDAPMTVDTTQLVARIKKRKVRLLTEQSRPS